MSLLLLLSHLHLHPHPSQIMTDLKIRYIQNCVNNFIIFTLTCQKLLIQFTLQMLILYHSSCNHHGITSSLYQQLLFGFTWRNHLFYFSPFCCIRFHQMTMWINILEISILQWTSWWVANCHIFNIYVYKIIILINIMYNKSRFI